MAKPKRKKLPPDPDGQNGDRARWALRAVDTFMQETGLEPIDGMDTAIGDLLCDLMHLCDHYGDCDFEKLLERAQYHYDEETMEEK